MATTPKKLFRGASTTNTATVLYTTNLNTTTIITNIVVHATAAASYSLLIDGFKLQTSTPLAANETHFIDLKQPIVTTGTAKTITGGASSTNIYFHISGVEIS